MNFVYRNPILSAIIAFVLVAILIASCSSNQPDYVASAPPIASGVPTAGSAPIVVQSSPAQSNSSDGFFSGYLMGHLLGGMNNGYSQPRTIINRTYVTPARPAYTPSRPSYSPPSYSRPSFTSRPSFSGFRGSFRGR